jgi:stalled ribosome rescue protein Dom34
LENQERLQEKKDVERLFESLGENPDKTFLNEEENRRALQAGAVDTLFLSSKLDKSLIRELTKMAEAMGSAVKMISTETPEGEQFYNLSGIGSILRFRV